MQDPENRFMSQTVNGRDEAVLAHAISGAVRVSLVIDRRTGERAVLFELLNGERQPFGEMDRKTVPEAIAAATLWRQEDANSGLANMIEAVLAKEAPEPRTACSYPIVIAPNALDRMRRHPA